LFGWYGDGAEDDLAANDAEDMEQFMCVKQSKVVRVKRLWLV